MNHVIVPHCSFICFKYDWIFVQVIFMPVSDNILACFQDDAIYVWKFDTFDYIKQIVPDMWESHHVKSIAFTREVWCQFCIYNSF